MIKRKTYNTNKRAKENIITIARKKKGKKWWRKSYSNYGREEDGTGREDTKTKEDNGREKNDNGKEEERKNKREQWKRSKW